MPRCQYCNKPMELKRFLKEDYDGNLLNERFLFVCDVCKILISPSLVMLKKETEDENNKLRDLYFKMNPPNDIKKKGVTDGS